MTELQQAYGGFEEETLAPQNNYFEEKQPQKQQQPKYQDPQQNQYVVKPDQQNQEFAQVVPQQPMQRRSYNTGYSFTDRMTMKRGDVMKLFVFALVIVLAIAIHKFGKHYISKYLEQNVFTDFQEFMIRLSYPVVILLTIWILKSL